MSQYNPIPRSRKPAPTLEALVIRLSATAALPQTAQEVPTAPESIGSWCPPSRGAR